MVENNHDSNIPDRKKGNFEEKKRKMTRRKKPIEVQQKKSQFTYFRY